MSDERIEDPARRRRRTVTAFCVAMVSVVGLFGYSLRDEWVARWRLDSFHSLIGTWCPANVGAEMSITFRVDGTDVLVRQFGHVVGIAQVRHGRLVLSSHHAAQMAVLPDADSPVHDFTISVFEHDEEFDVSIDDDLLRLRSKETCFVLKRCASRSKTSQS